MKNFDVSKLNQKIICSNATRSLLIALFDAELPRRVNLIPLDYHKRFESGDEHVEIAPNGHMLGSVQVRVTRVDGMRVGYSSDFFWPLDFVFDVDELVIDATFGSPEQRRRYDQQKVEEDFVGLLHQRLRQGPVAVLGYRGRLQYGMSLFAGQLNYPVLFSKRTATVIDVYREYGIEPPEGYVLGTVEAEHVLRCREKYVAFLELPERRRHPFVDQISKITLSAFSVPGESPILDYGNGDFRIALTDHADFDGTLEFVRASGAQRVLTDSTKGGNAQALAEAIQRELGVKAEPAELLQAPHWG
jgi:putative mRNA 3-end processing factor